MNELYFNLLTPMARGNEDLFNSICERNKLSAQARNNYRRILLAGAATPPEASFEATHGLHLAAAQGFFRQYFYTGDRGFTLLKDRLTLFRDFLQSWERILILPPNNPLLYGFAERSEGALASAGGAASGGVFISYSRVLRLLTALEVNSVARQGFREYFNEYQSVFMAALEYCRINVCGLLEATGVYNFNAADPGKTTSLTNPTRCDPIGPEIARRKQERLGSINRIGT
ncbi:MAG: hypothetical protein GX907_05950 [Clostridiaceae bacterium]|nr:hypothetical protein [Clostridiaceae bacterium]